jgi:iron complex outermembrane receptor protein
MGAWSGSVSAQGAAPVADQASTQAAAAPELQEVVVTAERRTTDVQQTPIAITAVTGDQLLELHLDTISSLQTTVPALTSDDTGSGLFNNINIRGMGDSIINPAITTGVAVLRDGLSMGETIGQSQAMYDIHDTSVLKGPQGTFVGASSTAGAIEITTNDPMLQGGIHGYAQAVVGNYTDNELQGAINLPWSDTFGARLAFDWIHRNSFSRDIGAIQPLVPGDSDQAIDPGHHYEHDVRLSLLWRPSAIYQALAKLEYSFIDTGDTDALPNPATYTTLFSAGPQAGGIEAGCHLGGPLSSNQVVCPGAGTVQHAQFWYPGEQPFIVNYYNNNQALNYYTQHFSIRQDVTFPDGIDLRSLTGFVRMNFNWLPNVSYSPANAGSQYHEFPDDDYYSQELDLISPTTGSFFGKVNWLVGAYGYYRYTPVYINNLSVPAPYTAGTLPNTDLIASNLATARSAAIFGQLNWQFTNTLQLQIGARDNWDNNFATQNPGPATAPPFTPELRPSGAGVYLLNYCGAAGPPICGANGLANGTPLYSLLVPLHSYGHYTDTVPTGKVDLNWTPVQGQNFYAFYARGYKAGGANAGSTDHPTWAPEHVNDFEVGWKGRLFDGHMLTQVGAYYYNYQDMQYQIYETQANNDTTTGSVVVNLAPTKIYGLEVAEQARFGGLGVNVGFSYNKSKLGNLQAVDSSRLPGGWGSPINHPQCLAGHSYSAGAPCFDYTPYLTNVSGEQNPFAPEITANVSVDYLFRVGAGDVTIDPRVTYSHTDKQYDSIFQNPYNLMGARNLWGGSVDFDARGYILQLWGTNLNNQVYIIGVNGANVNYGPPRQFGLRLTKNF